jgi:uncharacterized protein (TIGR02246 family)
VVGCQAAGPLSDADLAAIDDLRDAFVQARLAGDAAGIGALYAEDAVLLVPNMPAVTGRAAIQEFWEAASAATEFTATPTQTEGQGTLVAEHGAYSVTMPVEGMPEPITDTGKFVTIGEKQADGSWLVTVHIWNSDLPVPEPPGEGGTT